ncbi:LysR substrate-binding domain-containing protein [Mesorhizobium sp. BAC0120]|uniref:LysR substrate-binding domain-containing protein n=1 Tax=Mesorhizobium sp. BAC0120 TaxID=3090670 RepID=UPI00298CDE0F|nr:LysR substrate-binding domain-containing protein [Mesorhizobium sp. BAC0120]MDW6020826.1 LysR substrate-binding domain-containing protein [Mesorhizobium sp. BAC0120]
MNLNTVHLTGLRAVETVARTGSLQKAAEELGVSPSAVSQQIGRTEKQLGRPIFARTSNGLVPTEFGALFTAKLSAGFGELAGAVAMARQDQLCTLVISVAPAFASRWMVPRLSRFYEHHPEIMLRIDASTRIVHLERSDIDLAIRMGDGNWPGVEAELLIAQEMFPVAAPSIAARLRSVEDLANVSVLSDSNTMFSWERWFEGAGVKPVRPQPGATFTDPILCLEAAIAGQGVMLAWQLLAADALADGRLVAPFGVRAASGLGYYLVTPASGSQGRKVAAFRRWVKEEIGATMGKFGIGE